MDQNLLNILCCPETKQSLSVAETSFLDNLNAKIAEGQIKNRAGDVVSESVQTVLLREDKDVIYLVRQDIPIMLVDEAVLVSTINP